MQGCFFSPHVDFGIAVCRIKADMTKPGSYHINFDSSFKKMDCCGMPKDMRRYTSSLGIGFFGV